MNDASSLKSSKEEQDENHYQDHPQNTARTIAPALAIWPTGDGPYEQNNENNEQNCSHFHLLLRQARSRMTRHCFGRRHFPGPGYYPGFGASFPGLSNFLAITLPFINWMLIPPILIRTEDRRSRRTIRLFYFQCLLNSFCASSLEMPYLSWILPMS